MEFVFVLISFAALFSCSKELPIEGSTLPPEPLQMEQPHGVYFLPVGKSNFDSPEEIKTDGLDYLPDRSNHSQKLTVSTTLGYEEWWYMTSRRPRFSPKDFPGRPGVASWKEISPASSGDKKKDRKINGPTAAGVSSGSWSFSSSTHFIQMVWTVLCITFFLTCSCWT